MASGPSAPEPGSAMADNFLTCAICLDLLDNPWMCNDGWTYCRDCAARWVAYESGRNNGTWRSPRTNKLHSATAALLVADTQRDLLVTEARRATVEVVLREWTDPLQQLVAVAGQRHRGRPTAQQDQLRGLLERALRLDAEWDCAGPEALHSLVEVAVLSGLGVASLARRPQVIASLVENEVSQVGMPLLVLSVWTDLINALVECPEHRELLSTVWAHYQRRLRWVDSLTPSESWTRPRGLGDAGVFQRSPGLQESDSVTYVGLGGALVVCCQVPGSCVAKRGTIYRLDNRLLWVDCERAPWDCGSQASYWAGRRGTTSGAFPDAGSETSSLRLAVLEQPLSFLPATWTYSRTSRQDLRDVALLSERVGRALGQSRKRRA